MFVLTVPVFGCFPDTRDPVRSWSVTSLVLSMKWLQQPELLGAKLSPDWSLLFFPDLKSINNIYMYWLWWAWWATVAAIAVAQGCTCARTSVWELSIQGEVNHTNKTFDGSHVFRLYCEGNVAWEQYFLGSCLPLSQLCGALLWTRVCLLQWWWWWWRLVLGCCSCCLPVVLVAFFCWHLEGGWVGGWEAKKQKKQNRKKQEKHKRSKLKGENSEKRRSKKNEKQDKSRNDKRRKAKRQTRKQPDGSRKTNTPKRSKKSKQEQKKTTIFIHFPCYRSGWASHTRPVAGANCRLIKPSKSSQSRCNVKVVFRYFCWFKSGLDPAATHAPLYDEG